LADDLLLAHEVEQLSHRARRADSRESALLHRVQVWVVHRHAEDAVQPVRIRADLEHESSRENLPEDVAVVDVLRVGDELADAVPERGSREARDAVRFRQRQPDVEVDACRHGKLLVEEPPDAAALGVDAANDLINEPTVGERVVADLDARLPIGRLILKVLRHADVIEAVLHRDSLRDKRKSRLMTHDHLHGDVLLAVLAEFGPELDDLVIVGHLPSVDEHRHAQRAHRLARGEGDVHRVLLPETVALRVSVTSPDVHDRLAVLVHCKGGAVALPTRSEVLPEGPHHGLKLLRDAALRVHHALLRLDILVHDGGDDENGQHGEGGVRAALDDDLHHGREHVAWPGTHREEKKRGRREERT
ncbi:hypothetical protein PFISCL1PPCAC_7266, partial [Pristionchus fissidentatus]